jgi:hypothetical protein
LASDLPFFAAFHDLLHLGSSFHIFESSWNKSSKKKNIHTSAGPRCSNLDSFEGGTLVQKENPESFGIPGPPQDSI